MHIFEGSIEWQYESNREVAFPVTRLEHGFCAVVQLALHSEIIF